MLLKIVMPFWAVFIALFLVTSQGICSNTSIGDREQLVAFVMKHGDKRVTRKQAERIVDSALRTNNPHFILALISTESTYYHKAVSRVGAIGLGQIMCSVHCKDLKRRGIISGKQDLFDIGKNIRATEHVFNGYLAQTGGSHSRALARYLGANNKTYITKTMRTYARLQKGKGTKKREGR